MSHYVALGVKDRHASGNAGGTHVVPAIVRVDFAANRGQLDFPADVSAADHSGYGRCLYGPAHVANGLRSRNAGRVNGVVARHFDGIADGDMAQTRSFFANAESVALE